METNPDTKVLRRYRIHIVDKFLIEYWTATILHLD